MYIARGSYNNYYRESPSCFQVCLFQVGSVALPTLYQCVFLPALWTFLPCSLYKIVGVSHGKGRTKAFPRYRKSWHRNLLIPEANESPLVPLPSPFSSVPCFNHWLLLSLPLTSRHHHHSFIYVCVCISSSHATVLQTTQGHYSPVIGEIFGNNRLRSQRLQVQPLHVDILRFSFIKWGIFYRFYQNCR